MLPQNQDEVRQVLQERNVALEGIDAVKFLYGDIENQIISHYAAVYTVFTDKNGKYDFLTFQLSPVNLEVVKILNERLKRIN